MDSGGPCHSPSRPPCADGATRGRSSPPGPSPEAEFNARAPAACALEVSRAPRTRRRPRVRPPPRPRRSVNAARHTQRHLDRGDLRRAMARYTRSCGAPRCPAPAGPRRAAAQHVALVGSVDVPVPVSDPGPPPLDPEPAPRRGRRGRARAERHHRPTGTGPMPPDRRRPSTRRAGACRRPPAPIPEEPTVIAYEPSIVEAVRVALAVGRDVLWDNRRNRTVPAQSAYPWSPKMIVDIEPADTRCPHRPTVTRRPRAVLPHHPSPPGRRPMTVRLLAVAASAHIEPLSARPGPRPPDGHWRSPRSPPDHVAAPSSERAYHRKVDGARRSSGLSRRRRTVPELVQHRRTPQRLRR